MSGGGGTQPEGWVQPLLRMTAATTPHLGGITMHTHKSIDWNRPDWGGHVHLDPHGSDVPNSPKEEL